MRSNSSLMMYFSAFLGREKLDENFKPFFEAENFSQKLHFVTFRFFHQPRPLSHLSRPSVCRQQKAFVILLWYLNSILNFSEFHTESSSGKRHIGLRLVFCLRSLASLEVVKTVSRFFLPFVHFCRCRFVNVKDVCQMNSMLSPRSSKCFAVFVSGDTFVEKRR